MPPRGGDFMTMDDPALSAPSRRSRSSSSNHRRLASSPSTNPETMKRRQHRSRSNKGKSRSSSSKQKQSRNASSQQRRGDGDPNHHPEDTQRRSSSKQRMDTNHHPPNEESTKHPRKKEHKSKKKSGKSATDEKKKHHKKSSSDRDANKKSSSVKNDSNSNSNSNPKEAGATQQQTQQQQQPQPQQLPPQPQGVTVNQFLQHQRGMQHQASARKNVSLRQKMLHEQQPPQHRRQQHQAALIAAQDAQLLASSAQYFDDESEDPQQQQMMMVPRNHNNHNNPNHTHHTLPPLESTNSHHQVVDTVPADHPSSSIIQTSRTCSLCHRTLPRSQFSERDRFSINLSIAPGASCRTCAMTVSAVRLKGMPGTERLLADYARRGVARGMLLENGTVVPGTMGPNGVPIAGYLEGSDTNGMNSSDALVVRQPSGGVAGKELTLYGGGGGGMYGNDPNRNGANSNIMGMAPPPNNTDVNAAFSSGARPYGHSDADRSPRIADCKYIDSLLRMPSYLNLNAFGLFTSSGEASVSLAALEAVRLYGTLDESSFVPHDCEGMPVMDRVERKKKKSNKKKNKNNDDEEGGETKDPTTSSSSDERETINPKSIVCLVLNEGPTPRTSVLASQHYGWTSLAIDPALSEDWDGYHDDIPNFTGYSGSISDYMDDAGEMLIEFRDQSVRHLVIIAMQCGAGGSGSGDALRLKGNAHIDDIRSRYEDVPTTLVSLSPVRRATLAPYRRRAGMCGSKLEKDVGYEPNCSYVDEGVFSEVRMVEVWNFHNADDDDDDDEEEEEVEGGTRRSHQSGGDYVPKKTIPLERRYSHESSAAGGSDYVPPKKNHPSSVRQQPPPQGSNKKREEQRKTKKKKKEENRKKSGSGGGGRKKNNEWLEERVAQFKEKQQERGGGGDDGVDDGGGHANNNTNERDQQRQIVPQQEFAESFNTLSTKGTLERRDSDGDVLVRLPSEMGNDDGSDESKETSSPNGSDREQNHHRDSENRHHHHPHREGGEELEVWSPPDEEVANQVWEKAMAKHGEQETLVNQLEEYYNIENENEADDNDDRQARQGDDVPTNNDPQHGLPPNWEAIHDPASGDYYYNNWETGEVTWDRPLGNHPPAIEDQVDDDDNDESSSSVASSNPPEAGAVGTGYEDGPYMDDEYSQQSTSTQSTTPSYNAFGHSKAVDDDTKNNIQNDSDDDDGKEEDDAPPRYTGNSKLNNSRTSQSEEESEAYVFDDQSSASSGIAALSRWNEQTTDTTLGESNNADASQEEEDMIVWSSDEEEEEEEEDRLGEIERTGSNSSSLSRKQPWHKRDSGEVPGSNHDSFIYD